MERVDSEPSKGNFALFFRVENNRSAVSKCPARVACIVRRQGSIHGEVVERMITLRTNCRSKRTPHIRRIANSICVVQYANRWSCINCRAVYAHRMKRHILLVLFRLLLAPGVVYALPVSHLKWGEHYPGDGQQAFGFIIMFFVVGFAAAAVFIGLGSLGQFCFGSGLHVSPYSQIWPCFSCPPEFLLTAE